MKLAALLLILALAPLTLTSSANVPVVRPGDTFTLTIAADTPEQVLIVQNIDQARFEVVGAEPPDPRLVHGQLGHTALVSYYGPGPVSLVITLHVLPNAPGGDVELLSQAQTAAKIPIQSSAHVLIPYRFYLTLGG